MAERSQTISALLPKSLKWGALWCSFCLNAQASFNGCDPYETFQWSWDNTNIRYANTATVAGMDVIFGITANNNPTVQDPWNTTPAWAFPYAGSTTAPGPASATLIEQGLGPGHVVGVGGYAFINDLLYVEWARISIAQLEYSGQVWA